VRADGFPTCAGYIGSGKYLLRQRRVKHLSRRPFSQKSRPFTLMLIRVDPKYGSRPWRDARVRHCFVDVGRPRPSTSASQTHPVLWLPFGLDTPEGVSLLFPKSFGQERYISVSATGRVVDECPLHLPRSYPMQTKWKSEPQAVEWLSGLLASSAFMQFSLPE